MQNKTSRVLGGILFFLGVVLGLGMAILTVWAGFESVFYSFTRISNGSFNGLRCPTFLTPSETGIVTATFSNPTGETIEPFYRIEVSGAGLTQPAENQFSLASYSTKTVHWSVDQYDIDYGFFIFTKIIVYPLTDAQTREATCGIVVLDLPGLTGAQILDLVLALTLLGILIGLGMREQHLGSFEKASRSPERAMRALAVITLGAMLTGLEGWWLPGIFLCALAVLMLAVILRILGSL